MDSDWQLPDNGKTIRIKFYPAVILSIGGSQLIQCISVLCRVIPMDTPWFVYSRKNYIHQHEQRGARLKRLI